MRFKIARKTGELRAKLPESRVLKESAYVSRRKHFDLGGGGEDCIRSLLSVSGGRRYAPILQPIVREGPEEFELIRRQSASDGPTR